MGLVVCINNIDETNKVLNLTIGKIYEDVGSGVFTTDVINDLGNEVAYMKDRFIDLSEVRNEKIDKLLK